MKDFLQAIVYGGLFAVLFLPLLVANDLFFPFITGKNFAFRILVEVVFVSWVVLALLDARYRPRFSWLLVALTSFIAIVTAAAALGVHPPTSFWGNYERMDGVVTLIHIFVYFVVLGSACFSPKTWSIFLHTTVGVALWVALSGLAQYLGGGGGRIDGSLGNAAYMAIYMLFHIFFAALLFVRSKDVWLRLLYAGIALVFVYTLLLTGTRGTFLGMLAGAGVSVGYVALFGFRYPEFRKVAIISLVGLAILAGGFFALRDSAFIQENTSLSRIANIDLEEDLAVRTAIWDMALEGVEERPLLGWGHSNFNFVFNQNYDPFIYDQEQWFDRVHNIFFDWLIHAGVLGLLAYLSIFAALGYYLVWVPLRRKEEDRDFNALERAVVLGLVAGYAVHNLVVFDNIISYIFFGTVLALVHAGASRPMPKVQNFRLDQRLVLQIVAPVMLVAGVATVYYVNVPSLLAAGDIIDALRTNNVQQKLVHFDQALERDGFGQQEIVEQLAQQAMTISRNQEVPAEQRQMMVARAERELARLVDHKPNDARIHIFFANFYRAIGSVDRAREQAARARELTPQKPSLMLEQGIIELQASEIEAAQGFFEEAVAAAPGYDYARVLLAVTHFEQGDVAAAAELLDDEATMRRFASDDYAISAAQRAEAYELLAEAFQVRTERSPENAQNWATLSFVYYEMGEIETAIATLREAQEAVPGFADQAACFIDNLENGRAPGTGCTGS